MLCRPNFNHPICHLRIVDRVVDIIRGRSRFSLALQFQVYRQRLRSPTFFRSHAAAPLKLQPFYDDLPRHKSILKDWISGCQPIVSGVCEEGNPLGSLLPVRPFWARLREIILEFPQPWSPDGHVVTVAVFARKACRQRTLGRLFAYEGKEKEKSSRPRYACIDR